MNETKGAFAGFQKDSQDELILDCIKQSGRAIAHDIAANTGIKETTVRYHLTTMYHAGLVEPVRERRRLYWEVSDLVRYVHREVGVR